MRPMADAVTEVQVQTGSTSAEYGSYLGVHVNVVTKAGTNDFHGSLFEYFQDDSLESRGYFDNPDLPEPPKRSNQFGVAVRRPRDDSRACTTAATRRSSWAPTRGCAPSARPARLRRCRPSGCGAATSARSARRSSTPSPRQPYPGNQIPLSQLSDEAVRLLQYYPLPNLPGTANGTGNNYQAPALTESNIDQLLMRVDQNISNAARLYVRYNWVDAFDGFGNVVPTTGLFQPRVNKNTLGSWQQTLSPTLLNDFRIGYHRLDIDSLNNLDDRRRAVGRLRHRHPGLRRRRPL